jgi:uncharacterized protein
MNILRNAFQSDPQSALAMSGFLIGLAFGALAWRTNFCIMGAVSDWRTSGSPHRIGAVALAAAFAIVAAQILSSLGLTDLTRTIYLAPRLNWAGAAGGGLLFGFGMVSAGGCASRNLVRAGAGDARGLITLLVLALAAFATMGGVLGPLRAAVESATAISLDRFGLQTQSLGEVANGLGLSTSISPWLAPLLVAGPLAFFAFVRCRVGHDKLALLAGTGVGLLVAFGWLVTGLAYSDMDVSPAIPTSLTFVRPVADTMDWIARATALGLPGFGAASVFGTLAGSFLMARFHGRFRLQGFANNDDMLRHLGGALAMGVGGVLALGCSIGQGITGVSTLSIQSMIAAVSILTGAAWAMRRLERTI